MENRSYAVDLDAQKVGYEGQWLTKEDLAEKIRRMIDRQDFRIGSAGYALEYLQHTLANVREFSVTLGPDAASALERYAGKLGMPAGAFIRQAVLAYLAAQPPLEEGQTAPAPVTITTEPAGPGEESGAVELTRHKVPAPTSTVLVDPSLHHQPNSAGSIVSEENWFKK